MALLSTVISLSCEFKNLGVVRKGGQTDFGVGILEAEMVLFVLGT